MRRIALLSALGTMLLCAVPAVASPPTSFNGLVEAQNFSITLQRARIYDTAAYQAQLALDGAASATQALAAQAADPGRLFVGDLCWSLQNGCAGDIRLNNWATNGYGLVRPVLFTARDGATLSGHVWATIGSHPPSAKRPGIVLTPGSVQADEQMYWYAAQTLAKEGYVVLTFDAQGQGQSDTLGQAPDTLEGVPAQTSGTPFYDGTEDAINFFLSTPSHPYEPVKSCSTGTSHAAKQNARVAEGFDAADNPFWQLLDPNELGLVGHSYGAAGVSYIAQWDPRVKAVVALDNLGAPSPGGADGGENPCPADPADRTTVPVTKPGLGISADYGLPPTPNTSLPNPTYKDAESLQYTKAGVDSGEVVIRGGSHLDFSFIPNPAFGASYYGPDITDWYMSAWFDKYLKHAPGADAMLMTDRWRDYEPEAAIDPNHDGNAFSFYYYSRLDFHLADGKLWDCEDLRDGCPGMVPTADDGYPGNYSYAAIDTTPDSVTGVGAAIKSSSSLLPCTARQRIRFAFKPVKGRTIVRASVYVAGRRVLTRRGHALRSISIPGLPGNGRHRVTVRLYTRHGLARTIARTVRGCAARS
jgi:dienelactone hydrolase